MKYVRYVGLSHVREISAADWARAGINGETITWDAFNGFAVPLDRFTDQMLDKAIRPDSGFVITGEGETDGHFTPDITTANRPMTPQELEAPRVDILSDPTLENVSTGRTEAFPDGVNADATPGGDAPATTGRGRGSGKD